MMAGQSASEAWGTPIGQPHPRLLQRDVRVTTVMTCHNRRETTVACLTSYFSQRVPSTVSLDAVVVDDGSTDGTADAIDREFPLAHVIRGSGDLYWAGGMALAEASAEARGADYVLWLNDDVILDQDAVARLLVTAQAFQAPAIVVGAMRDPNTGTFTYSGMRRRGRHPLGVELVPPSNKPQVVEMFNGNVVLVSQGARRAVGGIDGKFSHGQADFDYALRAARSGVLTLLAPGAVGTCSRDGLAVPWLESSLSLKERARLLLGRKGVPPLSNARYLRRHGGPAWVIWWFSPYLKFMICAARDLVLRSRG